MDATTQKLLSYEADLKANGIRLDDVLKDAGVNRSTWARWKNGSSAPRATTRRCVEIAIWKALARARAIEAEAMAGMAAGGPA